MLIALNAWPYEICAIRATVWPVDFYSVCVIVEVDYRFDVIPLIFFDSHRGIALCKAAVLCDKVIASVDRICAMCAADDV